MVLSYIDELRPDEIIQELDHIERAIEYDADSPTPIGCRFDTILVITASEDRSI